MKRIHIHWTGGGYTPSAVDFEHYHFLIDGNGRTWPGKFPVIANARDVLTTGAYAAHTLKANSWAIGVSICSMAGATLTPLNYGKAPLKELQWQAMISLVAELAMRYQIPVKDTTILTHAEVSTNLGIPQKGKWDISVLPFSSVKGAGAIGAKLRREVLEEIQRRASKLPQNAPKPATATVGGGGGQTWTKPVSVTIIAEGRGGPVSATEGGKYPVNPEPSVAVSEPTLWQRIKAWFGA